MIDTIGRGGPMRPPNLGAQPVVRSGIAPASMAGTARTNAGGAAQAVREMAARPPVDTARVEALRTAIVAGTYKPDPQAIAARMIALEQGSGGR